MPTPRRLSTQRRRRALGLAQKGRSPAEIAAALQCSIHDVEFELEKGRSDADGSAESREGGDAGPSPKREPREPDETIDQLVGRRLRRARLSAGLTQARAAALLGVATQQFQKYEYGSGVKANILLRLAYIFQLPISYFFGDDAESADPRLRGGTALVPEDLAAREAVALARYYDQIANARIRRNLRETVYRLAGRPDRNSGDDGEADDEAHP